MNRKGATPVMRFFAESLLTYEAQAGPALAGKKPPAVLVCAKLRLPLATLMGNAGYRALLSRALALAQAEIPWPGEVVIKPDGSLGGWEALVAQVDPQEMAEAGVVLIAQLLGLLAAFIGKDLMLRQVGEVWPTVELNESDLVTKGENEKTE